ncbi:exonuclease domain-containing protein [Patescibacteria group bacterium]|nr:exonuclease domain-containing protein [Patescibacteria group bacterium]
MLPPKIAFVDIETTGTSLRRDRIIEIGVLRVEKNKLTDTYQTLVNPETYLPPEITLLTGIKTSDLENAPTFSEVARNLTEILDGCVFAAHNARFDYGFIRQQLAGYGIKYRAKNLCTVKLSRLLFPQNRHHKLDNLIEQFSLNCERRHRAFDDAAVLWDFYKKLLKEIPEEKFEIIINQVLRKPNRPINVSEKILDNLPEGPGVYIFYDQDGAPLYVGKSVNINDRVLSHFASDNEIKLSGQVASIETIETKTELEALLLESKKIKELQPLHNRMLRKTQKLVVLKQDKSGDYNTVKIDTVNKIMPGEVEEILGVFRSVKQAKDTLVNLAKEQKLCERLLGVETTNRACFGYRLGRCKGACVKKEKPALYNARFALAFMNSRIKHWPFKGPRLLENKYLVDNWCLVGEDFDLDTYKILQRYLRNQRRQIRTYSR